MNESYKELGFKYSDRKILDDEIIEIVQDGVNDILAGTYNTGMQPKKISWTIGQPAERLCELDGAHLCHTAIRDLLSYKPMIDFMVEVTGAKSIKLMASQLFYKPPHGLFEDRKNFIPYHQDGLYLGDHFKEASLFSCWVPLCDMSEQNGSMTYIARSQNLGPKINNVGYMKINLDEARFKQFNCYPELVAIPKGFLSIHHGDLLHGSGANYSNKPRAAIVLHCLMDNFEPNLTDSASLQNPQLANIFDDPFCFPVLL